MLSSKFESLFYKINTCLQKNFHFHWIGGIANILCKNRIYNIYIYIYIYSILGVAFVAFAISFPCYFQKLQILVVKKIWNNFCCIVIVFVWAQKLSQILKIFFQFGSINIYVLHGLFFSRSVQLKSSFSD